MRKKNSASVFCLEDEEMNCKQGDLAMVVRVSHAVNNWALGQIVRCVSYEKLSDIDGWRLEEGITHADSTLEWYWIADFCLRPIRDNEGEDEILRIAGIPGEVSA